MQAPAVRPVNNDVEPAARPVPSRASIPIRANNPREEVPVTPPKRIVVNRQRSRARRPINSRQNPNAQVEQQRPNFDPRTVSRPVAQVEQDESFASFPARPAVIPTPVPARPAPTPARPAPTPARPAPTPARAVPTPSRPTAQDPLAQLEQIASGGEAEFTSFPARSSSRQTARTSARPSTIRINPRPTQSSRASQTSRSRTESPRAILPTQPTRAESPRSGVPTNFPAFQSFSANPSTEPVEPAFNSFPANVQNNQPVLPTRQPDRPAFAPTPVPRRSEASRASRPSPTPASSGAPSRFSSFPVQGRPVLPDSPRQREPVAVPQPAVVPQQPPVNPNLSLIPKQRQPQPFRPDSSRPVAQAEPSDPRRVNFDALIQEFTGGQRRPQASNEPSFFNAIPVEQPAPRQFRPQPAVPSLQNQGGSASFSLVTELL